MTNSRSLITRFALPLAATALVLTACGSTTASPETSAAATESAMAAEDGAAEEMASSDEMASEGAEGHSDDGSSEEMAEGDEMAGEDEMAAESSAGAYINLADYEGSKEMYDEGKVVLFFNASWCSTCKEARENLEADPAAIPAGLTIVKVDYDDSDDLKQKYGVTVQHTFVQVDADGNEIAKWNGSVTADEIEKQTA
jgi:thiol-disulfide isomerase/thioredoxin